MKYSPYQLDAIELFASRHRLTLKLKPFAERVIHLHQPQHWRGGVGRVARDYELVCGGSEVTTVLTTFIIIAVVQAIYWVGVVLGMLSERAKWQLKEAERRGRR